MKKILLLLVMFGKVYGQSNIHVGEKAPIIHISNWIKNEPQNKNLSNKYIVLEFWATWCGPCIAAVPHLNELQKKYNQANLYYISLTDESVEKVERTLKRIDFHSIVATDTTKETFIKFGNGTDGLDAYPLTVLIDTKGMIKWIGEPMNLNEEVMNDFLNLNNEIKMDEVENKSDSISKNAITFKSLMGDKTIKYHFQLNETNSADTYKFRMGNTLMDIKAYTLQEIFLDVFDINIGDMPKAIVGKRFNLLYKNVEDKDALVRLEQEILNQLKLNRVVEKRPADFYVVDVKDFSKLDSTLETKFSSKSNAGDKIIFTAYSIANMLEEISKMKSINFRYKGKDIGKYDFIIEIKELENLFESFASYGLEYSIEKSFVDYSILKLRD